MNNEDNSEEIESSKPFEVKVSCKYGAPMGRASDGDPPDVALTLECVPLDDGGYDPGGAYWGIGEPLFCVWTDEADDFVYEYYLRAQDSRQASTAFLKEYPDAVINSGGLS